MENQLRGKKGITLIALVITIIVLLILAGVTIATLTGDNGLLQKATGAKQANEEAKELELIKVAVSAAKTNEENLITIDNLNHELEVNFKKNVNLTGNSPWLYKGDYNQYYINEDGIIKCKEDYSELQVGDYVNYPVSYQNVSSNYEPTEDYIGWRILSIDKENNEVKLVSAGIPIKYNTNNNKTALERESELTINFWSTDFASTEGFNQEWKKDIFDNQYTEKNTLNESTSEINIDSELVGYPKIQVFSKNDLEEVLGEKAVNGTSVVSNDLLGIPSTTEDCYAVYWLATPTSKSLWSVYGWGAQKGDGTVRSDSWKTTLGVRLVVYLNRNLKFYKTENTSDIWQLDI